MVVAWDVNDVDCFARGFILFNSRCRDSYFHGILGLVNFDGCDGSSHLFSQQVVEERSLARVSRTTQK